MYPLGWSGFHPPTLLTRSERTLTVRLRPPPVSLAKYKWPDCRVWDVGVDAITKARTVGLTAKTKGVPRHPKCDIGEAEFT
jgi:hypothetical protein